MGLPDYVSATQLATYARCPRQFQFRYLDDAPREYRSVSLALGSVVHGVIEWWFDRRREGHETTIEEAMRILRADFAAATHDDIRWGEWTPSDLRNHAGRLVSTFLRTYGEIEVEQTEQRFELPIVDPDTGEILERPLIGYFDLVLGGGRVLEVKTARSDFSPLDLTTSLQFGAYLMAIRELYGSGELELAVIIKNKSPRLQRLKLHPQPETERWFLRAACTIERAIQAGHFPPAPGFSCGGCEFQRRCLVGEAEARSHEAA